MKYILFFLLLLPLIGKSQTVTTYTLDSAQVGGKMVYYLIRSDAVPMPDSTVSLFETKMAFRRKSELRENVRNMDAQIKADSTAAKVLTDKYKKERLTRKNLLLELKN